MRPLRLWHRVGAPTWKRSGTLVFTAVIGVLLIGGTAMAANLGLLTSTTPGDRDYRLDVRRPVLSVTLPPTEPAPASVESTSNLDDGDEDDADVADDVVTDNPPATERSAGDEPADADGTGDGMDSTPEGEADEHDAADEHDDADDHRHDGAESTSEQQREDSRRNRAETGGGRWKGDDGRFHGDGSLDDD